MEHSITREQHGALVEQHLKAIRPLVRDGAGVLNDIALPDAFSVAYTWSPEFKGPADMSDLVVVGEAWTLHAAGYIQFFKPSLGEVIATAPAELLAKAVAFELLRDTVSIVEDLPGFYGHRAQVVFYGRA